MVSFSAWQEAPDYLQFHTIFATDSVDPVDGQPLFDYGATGVFNQTPFQDPRYPVTVADLELAVEVATPPGPEGNGGPPEGIDALWGVQYSWGYELSDPNWRSTWKASSVHRSMRIAPATDYTFNPAFEGYELPPGTIGIDYEGLPYDPSAYAWRNGPSTVVSRALSAAGTSFGGAWQMDDGVGVPASPTEVVLRPYNSEAPPITVDLLPPPESPTTVGQTAHRALTGTVDITNLVKDTQWAGTVWTRQGAPFVTPNTDPTTGSALNNGGIVKYGWGLEQLRIDTMVRPPRWRWVLKDDSTPYRRTFPRDDSLAGGAARTFPRPRSVQGSNRTSGGYL